MFALEFAHVFAHVFLSLQEHTREHLKNTRLETRTRKTSSQNVTISQTISTVLIKIYIIITVIQFFLADYAEALQFKLKQRGPPPVYNERRLLERPIPVLPRFANSLASRRMSAPLPLSSPLSRGALQPTQQNRKPIVLNRVSL